MTLVLLIGFGLVMVIIELITKKRMYSFVYLSLLSFLFFITVVAPQPSAFNFGRLSFILFLAIVGFKLHIKNKAKSPG